MMIKLTKAVYSDLDRENSISAFMHLCSGFNKQEHILLLEILTQSNGREATIGIRHTWNCCGTNLKLRNWKGIQSFQLATTEENHS